MRILMIAPGPIPVPPTRGGSVEICMSAIARLLREGHDVVLVSRQFPGLASVSQEGRLTFLRVVVPPGGSYIRTVIRRLRGQSFDRIQVDNRPVYVPLIRKAFPGTPVSVFLQSLTYTPAGRLTASRLGQADLVLANSRSLHRRLAARFPAIKGKLRTVHLGVDFERFRPPLPEERADLRRIHGLEDRYAVLFAGRVIPRKGLDVLVRAVRVLRRTVPNAVLVIAGTSGVSGYGKTIRLLAKRERVPVRFLGKLPHTIMQHAYWLADCFVCPSQLHEAFGLVNVEAMATGLPCAASAIGGIPEIIVDGVNGLIVKEYRRPEAFARAIARLAADPALSERLGMAACATARGAFGWLRTAERLAELYGAPGPLIMAKEEMVYHGETVEEEAEVRSEQMEENDGAAGIGSDPPLFAAP